MVEIGSRLPESYQRLVEAEGLGEVVRYRKEAVDFSEMFRLLSSIDVVLFLVDGSVRACASYNRYKISGSSTLVKSFRKVCAASRDFKLDEVLEERSVRYDGRAVEEVFEAIGTGVLNKEAVRELEQTYSVSGIPSREEESRRFASLLEGMKG